MADGTIPFKKVNGKEMWYPVQQNCVPVTKNKWWLDNINQFSNPYWSREIGTSNCLSKYPPEGWEWRKDGLAPAIVRK